MSRERNKITVYYDGACPICIKDRADYEKLAGEGGKDVLWFDITGRDAEVENHVEQGNKPAQKEDGVDDEKAGEERGQNLGGDINVEQYGHGFQVFLVATLNCCPFFSR